MSAHPYTIRLLEQKALIATTIEKIYTRKLDLVPKTNSNPSIGFEILVEKRTILDTLNRTYNNYMFNLFNFTQIIHNQITLECTIKCDKLAVEEEYQNKLMELKNKSKTKSAHFKYASFVRRNEDDSIKCNICDKSLANRRSFCSHLRAQHPKWVRKCEKQLAKSKTPKSDENFMLTKDSKYQCRKCNKIMLKGSRLRHLQMHAGILPFGCKYCDKKFAQKYTMIIHERIHTGEKPFECNVCKRRFGDPSNLTSHTKTHTNERSYECNVCGKTYKHSNQIKRHMRSHTNEKPFKCRIGGCNKEYASKHGYMNHVRTKHNLGNKIIKYECDLCGLEFSSKSALSTHKISVHKTLNHLPIQCDLCECRAATTWGLKIHKAQIHKVDMDVSFGRDGSAKAVYT